MLYLLDANVLIDANRDYYTIERVPQFWDWLAEMSESNRIKVPQEVFDKVVNAQDDSLSGWLKANQAVMSPEETVDTVLLQRVIDQGYANNLTDIEQGRLNEDPFLIAYALSDIANRAVVSNEASSPNKQRANRKIPDVCSNFDPEVSCINIFELIRNLDFRIQ